MYNNMDRFIVRFHSGKIQRFWYLLHRKKIQAYQYVVNQGKSNNTLFKLFKITDKEILVINNYVSTGVIIFACAKLLYQGSGKQIVKDIVLTIMCLAKHIPWVRYKSKICELK